MKLFRFSITSVTSTLLIGMFCLTWSTAQAQIFDTNKPETNPMWQLDTVAETLWSVKAFRQDDRLFPEEMLIQVKAIDAEGNKHDVKGIQTSGNTSILDVKALVNGERLPVKMIVNETDQYLPVKAIANDGTLIAIKAITAEGKLLDVKGVSKTGNVIHIRAISEYGNFYNIIAISPSGRTNDVKGIKMGTASVETTVNNVEVFAHVKAIRQY